MFFRLLVVALVCNIASGSWLTGGSSSINPVNHRSVRDNVGLIEKYPFMMVESRVEVEDGIRNRKFFVYYSITAPILNEREQHFELHTFNPQELYAALDGQPNGEAAQRALDRLEDDSAFVVDVDLQVDAHFIWSERTGRIASNGLIESKDVAEAINKACTQKIRYSFYNH
ncbi:hypothetical protein PTTG_26820 [Puccinia triticina 1-1 BBBD Race 1]|uniref:Uncharacterized protein n=1 Tax=Puccinia triticina (isolate 1-1 / race 1 (BBBD)) TaxID=630390 RepID=A0A180GSK2_PUCT1|nr:hypothetical protein PTTG_26820 [Puccinia triticina 1-1 BBBD Race 1]